MANVAVISIVDDDETICDALSRLVRALGFTCRTFSSADTFLNSEHLNATSCLITDIHMPEMNGTELQEALRAGGHNIPIVFITAYPDTQIRSQVLAQGAICFLEKPVEGEALSRCISAALRKGFGTNA